MTSKKRRRGRPSEGGPKRLQIDWRRFVCDHANPVAQSYVCIPNAPEPKSDKDPTRYLLPGMCFVIYLKETPAGLVERLYRDDQDRVAVFDRPAAEARAKALFLSTDEEERFGSLTGPNRNVLYRNRHFEVRFTQASGYVRPFVIVDNRQGKVLLDRRGKMRRFFTLSGATDAANAEEKKLL